MNSHTPCLTVCLLHDVALVVLNVVLHEALELALLPTNALMVASALIIKFSLVMVAFLDAEHLQN